MYRKRLQDEAGNGGKMKLGADEDRCYLIIIIMPIIISIFITIVLVGIIIVIIHNIIIFINVLIILANIPMASAIYGISNSHAS